ncbi:hypothetical protein [Pseudomonas shahriarae]|uniref:hypothetical protein n=1 Tax=Pseudomonas shahriarae TaxID=2745512 RepID=UPI0023600C97|nr:hypothetical protein [Pseudomonas shahriarae]MDD1131843.1 hypothetical protein [Pseudomonas shahriarae]
MNVLHHNEIQIPDTGDGRTPQQYFTFQRTKKNIAVAFGVSADEGGINHRNCLHPFTLTKSIKVMLLERVRSVLHPTLGFLDDTITLPLSKNPTQEHNIHKDLT